MELACQPVALAALGRLFGGRCALGQLAIGSHQSLMFCPQPIDQLQDHIAQQCDHGQAAQATNQVDGRDCRVGADQGRQGGIPNQQRGQ